MTYEVLWHARALRQLLDLRTGGKHPSSTLPSSGMRPPAKASCGRSPPRTERSFASTPAGSTSGSRSTAMRAPSRSGPSGASRRSRCPAARESRDAAGRSDAMVRGRTMRVDLDREPEPDAARRDGSRAALAARPRGDAPRGARRPFRPPRAGTTERRIRAAHHAIDPHHDDARVGNALKRGSACWQA